MRAVLPTLYSDLSRPYVPGLVAHETLRRQDNADLTRSVLVALATRLVHLSEYR